MKKLYSIMRKVPSSQPLDGRVQVRSFRTADAMHKFLNNQYDNNWSIMDEPQKSGFYEWVGHDLLDENWRHSR